MANNDELAETAEILADAMIRSTGSRKAAIAEAEKRCAKTKRDKAEWLQVRDLLRSGKDIPAHHLKLPGFANPHEVYYERVEFNRGGVVGGRSGKVSKTEADYRRGNSAHHCAICTMYRNGSCTKVAGAISPKALCDYFELDKERAKERAEGGSVLHQRGQHAPGVHYERAPVRRAPWWNRQPDGNNGYE